MTESKPVYKLQSTIRGVSLIGLIVIVLCFGGIGTWAAFAPLSSAAIAAGQISPDGSQRTVQHLEGGIIQKLHIKEGDLISEGMVLITLDKAQAEANFQSKSRNLQRLKVLRERLYAQQKGQDQFDLQIDEELKNDKSFNQFINNEIATFQLMRKLDKENILIFKHQEDQVFSEIESLESQARGLKDQTVLIEKELKSKMGLVDKGYLKKPELYAVQRKFAELTSKYDSMSSTISRARQKISEIQVSKISIKTESLERVAKELSKVNSEISQAEESFNATADILARTNIVSSVDGRVLKLNYKTIGGVVRPGEPILTIVPINEELIVDAKLSPTDIDNVAVGMKARIQLSSYITRYLPPFEGEVLQVGADVVTDPDTREKYFTLRVRIDAKDLKLADQGITLMAGMPVEVFVQTGIHTPFRYFWDPIVKSFNRAFREETM